MATGFPAATGDVLSAAMYNGLVTFTLNDQTGLTYVPVLTDSYQVLVTRSNAAASTMILPLNSTTAFPVGSCITVLNKGAGLVSISGIAGVTVLSAGTVAAIPTLAQYKSAAIIKVATDTWYVVGAIA
jgi:hypothetical protein